MMKSNYQSTSTEHLENRRPKCKMQTQERQLTRFLYIITDPHIKPNRHFAKLNQNRNRTRGFSQNRTETEPNLKNPFRTSLVTNMPMKRHTWHKPRVQHLNHCNTINWCDGVFPAVNISAPQQTSHKVYNVVCTAETKFKKCALHLSILFLRSTSAPLEVLKSQKLNCNANERLAPVKAWTKLTRRDMVVKRQ